MTSRGNRIPLVDNIFHYLILKSGTLHQLAQTMLNATEPAPAVWEAALVACFDKHHSVDHLVFSEFCTRTIYNLTTCFFQNIIAFAH